MKSQQELLEQLARNVGYEDWASLNNLIVGDQELVEFYLKVFASLYAEEVLKMVASRCEINDNNWHKTITEEDILKIRNEI